MRFQDLIARLQGYWGNLGCLVVQPYDAAVGAGTMHPATFLRVIGPEPWNVAYVQPSRRPADARYGENPFRLGIHHQFQVIMKPSPLDIQQLYLRSLVELGIVLADHDIRFEEDNWESPTLGAWGVGWQVLMDGMEITQFTYFQQAGGIDLQPISAEITYGIERLCMFLAKKESVYEVEWGGSVAYGTVRHDEEVQFSRYYFEAADVALHTLLFDRMEAEARACLERQLVYPAYDCVLALSHIFNVLDARGAVSVTERIGFIKRVRDLAVACARGHAERRAALGYPMLPPDQREAALGGAVLEASTGPREAKK